MMDYRNYCTARKKRRKILSLPESSVEWLLRTGKLPRHKVAGKIRFTLEDLQVLITASAVDSSAALGGK